VPGGKSGPINLAVIGFGDRARSVVREIRAVDEQVRVVAVGDPHRNEERAAELPDARWYDDPVAALDHPGIDGVVIGSPNAAHWQQAVAVLERNLPLFLEKPVVVDWHEHRAVSAAATASSSPVVVSFPLRLTPMVVQLQELIKRIGPVMHVQAVNNVPSYGVGAMFHGWRRDQSLSGGMWMEKATHDLDYLTLLVGAQPVDVVAMEAQGVFRGTVPAGTLCRSCDHAATCPESPEAMQRIDDPVMRSPYWQPDSWQCVFGEDSTNHDAGTAIIRYDNGAQVVYSQNFYSRRGAAARGGKLVGHRGTIEFDFFSGVVKVIDHFSDQVDTHDTTTAQPHFGGDAELARTFVAACRGVASSDAPLEAGLTSAAVALAARESCRTGAVVAVPSVAAAAAVGGTASVASAVRA